ncbi:type II secretion system F family protein [Pseudarthrobacter sp. J1738]|uniref:type II secretion system F family protein n=1 Tax=unclassified Pseudarthrobacter TaxID=2647000 RepID=UPI003D2C879B
MNLLLFCALLAGTYLLIKPPQSRLWAERIAGDSRRQSGSQGNHERIREPQSPGTDLDDLPMMLELAGAMLDSGASLYRVLELLRSVSEPGLQKAMAPVVAGLGLGTDWETAWRGSRSSVTRTSTKRLIEGLKEGLGFAATTGAPSSAILYTQAARIRRQQHRAAEKQAATLGVRLVIPLGLCCLPAFICLGVIPVLLAMLPAGL